ncbi:hypothetical protein Tco_1442603, partial [Tanacetum coccineum]
MDDPNITMEEYIRLEEEKDRRHGRTFNWQTATFGKVKKYEDEDDYPIDFKTEFLAIVFDNTLTAIPSEPTICPPNENEVDFRILLDEFDDEDYTVIFDENPFSYKIISVNDLKKTDSGNNRPLSPNDLDDLDYFKNFENEFPAIVYNNGLTSKSDLGIKPLVNSECIDEFNLIDETSLSEYDEEIFSRFNDLFNDIHPDDLKSKKDDDDNNIGIIQSSEDNEITHGENGFSKTSHDKIIKTFETGSFVINLNIVIWNYYVNGMLFFLINLYVPYGIPFDPKRYYKDGYHKNVAEAKVHILDFEGLTPEMRQDLAVRLRMVYSGERQQAAVASAPEADEAGQVAEKVAQEIPVLALAPAQPPPQPPPAPQPHTMSQRIERVEEE